MQSEQYSSSYDQSVKQIGTPFEHGNQIDLHVSDLARLEAERARADIDAATARPLDEIVETRLEHAPLSPQELVKLIGQKVVFDLRKGYNETHINLFEETESSTPYIYNKDKASTLSAEQTGRQTDDLSRDDLGLAA